MIYGCAQISDTASSLHPPLTLQLSWPCNRRIL